MGDESARVKTFLSGLDQLRQRSGSKLAFEDISALLARHAGPGYAGQDCAALYEGIQRIAGKIQTARVEIASVHPDRIAGDMLPDANLELDAVVKHTEEAANKIMEAAEAIQAIADRIGGEAGSKIAEQVTGIFEASSFQDITGQRIRKVIRTLADVEEAVKALTGAMEGKVAIETKQAVKARKRPDEDLMNGPQLAAPSQDDIDRLFSGG